MPPTPGFLREDIDSSQGRFPRLSPRKFLRRAFMDGPIEVEVSSLLQRLRSGDDDASQRLLALLYLELHDLAVGCMKGQPADHTLQATALVHEAYLRMDLKRARHFDDRARFMAFASKAMRCVLVDHARAKLRLKRSAPETAQPLDQIVVTYEEHALDLVALDEALSRLATFDETMARVVELRFFGGLEMQEIADLLGLGKRTLERQWAATRAWLLQEVSSP